MVGGALDRVFAYVGFVAIAEFFQGFVNDGFGDFTAFFRLSCRRLQNVDNESRGHTDNTGCHIFDKGVAYVFLQISAYVFEDNLDKHHSFLLA